ncbi:hypothetical protein [Galactobacter valiniphilus]|nr:hypothetical protein [Galactobacter valiniphilus]
MEMRRVVHRRLDLGRAEIIAISRHVAQQARASAGIEGIDLGDEMDSALEEEGVRHSLLTRGLELEPEPDQLSPERRRARAILERLRVKRGGDG